MTEPTGRPAIRRSPRSEEWATLPSCPRAAARAAARPTRCRSGRGHCWYYLRYRDPENDARRSAIPRQERYWMPVDLYVGGAEHAVLHLLTRASLGTGVLYDLGVVSTTEPFRTLGTRA